MTTDTNTNSLVDEAWMTTADVVKYTQRSIATVHRAVAAEILRSTQAGRGRGRRYRREWVDAWLLNGATGPQAAIQPRSRTA